MTSDLVSVIIPVYNTEKYLDICVKSVFNQTYKQLEIILVDDGSTDSSVNKCDEYQKLDSRVIVLHKKNGGLSSARNEGTKIAKGNFIVYLDSDDYLAPNFIQKSLDLCTNENADIAIMQMCYIPENVNEIIVNESNERINRLNTKEAIEASFYQVLYSCCAPSKMYRKEVLRDIEFPLGRLSEDLAVCHRILGNAKLIVNSTEYGYYYRQHPSSIMHTFNPQRLDALEWCRDIESYCKNNYPDILSAAKCRTFNVAIHLLLDLPNDGKIRDNCHKEIMMEVKRTRFIVLFNKKTRFREKAAAFISLFGESILKMVWNSKIAVKRVGN